MRVAAILVAITLALPAHAFQARNGMTVAPSGGQDFTVKFDSQAADADYWCAAGDFAQRSLGLASKTRVYRMSPTPRKAGQGISFTLDAAKASGQTGITTFGGLNDGAFSAGGAAASFCENFRFPRLY